MKLGTCTLGAVARCCDTFVNVVVPFAAKCTTLLFPTEAVAKMLGVSTLDAAKLQQQHKRDANEDAKRRVQFNELSSMQKSVVLLLQEFTSTHLETSPTKAATVQGVQQ